MDERGVRIKEFIVVLVLMVMAFAGGSIGASFLTANSVENHIDATILHTVEQAQNNNKGASAAAQKLFKEVDQICQSLAKNPASGIHC